MAPDESEGELAALLIATEAAEAAEAEAAAAEAEPPSEETQRRLALIRKSEAAHAELAASGELAAEKPDSLKAGMLELGPQPRVEVEGKRVREQ